MLRRACHKIHLWLGLTLGLYFALMGVTGSVLVFGEEIDRALNPDLLRVDPAAKPAPFSEVLTGFRAAYPDAPISRVGVPTEAGMPYDFQVGPWSASMLQVYVDPATGEVLGERRLCSSIVGFLQYLHFNLLGGDTGWLLNGIGGLVLLGVLATGLVIWWPRTLGQCWTRLKVKWSASGTRVNWDLHNAVGAWSLPLMVIITATGAVFAFWGSVSWAVQGMLGKAEVQQMAPPAAPDAAARSVDHLLAAARAAFPEGEVFRIQQPDSAAKPMRVLFWAPPGGEAWGERVTVEVDRYSGEVLSLHDPRTAAGDRVMGAIYPVHAGFFGGLAIRLLYAAVGMVPVLLAVTGTLMWLNRGGARRLWRRRRRRLVAREAVGGLSRVSSRA